MARHQDREERLAAALRDNLRKRKAQSRAADAKGSPETEPPSADGAA